MGRTSYHHGNLRRALLDAALALVAEAGPDGFTMAEAARRAGVSSGAPYQHFPDRAALMRALYAEAAEHLQQAAAQAMEGADSPNEAFRRLGVAYVRFAAEHPASFRVLNMPEYAGDTLLQGPDQAYWQAVRAGLEAVAPDAPLDPQDPVWINLAARVLVHGLATLFVSGQLGSLGISPDRAGQLADVVTLAAAQIGRASEEP